MRDSWCQAVIKKIAIVTYVEVGVGHTVHQNRPYHGFVLNDEGAERDYYFSDGTVLHTHGGELFYLPKNSTYSVKMLTEVGGCYAVNFDADIEDIPFSMYLRDREPLFKLFENALRHWKRQSELCHIIAMNAVYEIICLLQTEKRKRYVPDKKMHILQPALEKIATDFSQNDLPISALASLCGISEVYFRRLFADKLGVSPKEYIVRLRMNYAKQLLDSGQFSVSETALMCGYNDICHFSRAFLSRVGISPGDFKKGIK